MMIVQHKVSVLASRTRHSSQRKGGLLGCARQYNGEVYMQCYDAGTAERTHTHTRRHTRTHAGTMRGKHGDEVRSSLGRKAWRQFLADRRTGRCAATGSSSEPSPGAAS